MTDISPNPRLTQMVGIMAQHIADQLEPPAPGSQPVRRRQTSIILTHQLPVASQRELELELVGRALDEITVLLLDGFGIPSLPEVEEQNHLPRDWLKLKIEQIWDGTHAWSRHLEVAQTVQEMQRLASYGPPEYLIAAAYGISVHPTSQGGHTPVPYAFLQLLRDEQQPEFTVVHVEHYQPR